MLGLIITSFNIILFLLAIFMYTSIILFSKNKVLTTLGIYMNVISILGIVYCFCVLMGINFEVMF